MRGGGGLNVGFALKNLRYYDAKSGIPHNLGQFSKKDCVSIWGILDLFTLGISRWLDPLSANKRNHPLYRFYIAPFVLIKTIVSAALTAICFFFILTRHLFAEIKMHFLRKKAFKHEDLSVLSKRVDEIMERSYEKGNPMPWAVQPAPNDNNTISFLIQGRCTNVRVTVNPRKDIKAMKAAYQLNLFNCNNFAVCWERNLLQDAQAAESLDNFHLFKPSGG